MRCGHPALGGGDLGHASAHRPALREPAVPGHDRRRGGAAADAWLTIGHVGNAGMCNLDSVELDEMRQPIHVHSRRLLPDTEGAGETTGAPSIAVEYGPVGCDISVGYVSDGCFNPARGVRGGGEGGAANQFRIGPDGARTGLPGCAQVMLHEGERILAVSCGGGGYGAPMRRDPELVARDVAAGWVSPGRAEAVYGVRIGPDGAPDRDATARLRAAASG
jgi:N-methylhydantoinase B